MGERSCVDGTWGECVGTTTLQIYVPPPAPPGVHTQTLATGPVSCMDVCDPNCQKLADSPDALDPGPDFMADLGGLTLHSAGFTSGNCPNVVVTPDTATLEITSITEAAGVVTLTPSSVPLVATCGVGGLPISPSWKTDQPDRAWVKADGTFNVFSAVVGDIQATGSSAVASDTSTITVKVNVKEYDATVSAAVKTQFAGATTGTDPGKTLYPYKNTVFPLDLKAPVVQWKSGGTNAANVQVALRYPAGAGPYKFWYSHLFAGEPTQGPVQPTAGAPAFPLPQAVWTALGRSAVGDTAEIVVQRSADAATLYPPLVIPVKFATAPLRGTVYYTQYLRKLTGVGGGQTDLPATFDPLNPGTTTCPVGNNTHVQPGSTTRAIDMSTPAAPNVQPLGANGCPVCHSVSANGNMYVAGSRFLQPDDNTGFVNSISVTAAGATFTQIGEAPNYDSLRSATSDWSSRGFSFAALSPDGALALQGPYWWGNTQPNGGDNLTVDRPSIAGGKTEPMFFVPTRINGSTVHYATTAALAATRSGDVLTGSAGTLLPTIDGVSLAVGDSLLVKDQADPRDNGVYQVTQLGGCGYGTNWTTSTTLTATTSSVTGGNVAANAFDNNNTTTRWESTQGVDPQWLVIDLGATRSIGRVLIDWEAASAKDYKIQVGASATGPWTDLATVSNTSGMNHRIDDLLCLSGSGRYVRMYGTTRTGMYGYSIWEMDVFDSGATGGLPFTLTRRSDFRSPATYDGPGSKKNWEVRVTRGNANYGHVFRLTSPAADPTINTDNLVFTDLNASVLPVMTMPSISPDGKKLVYVNGDSDALPSGQTTAWRKGLTMLTLDQATRQVSAKTRLVNNWTMAADANGVKGGVPVKWPFFEQDSRSIVYVQTDADEYCRSGSDLTNDAGRACYGDGLAFANAAPTQRGKWPGRLYSIDSQNPATTATELATLNNAEDPLDAGKAFQPTVLPFDSGGYRWVIFTSPRSYGNQLNQLGATKATDFSCAATLLWIAALDNQTAGAADRSHPAFLLPGQNLAPITQANHYLNERGYLVPSQCKGVDLTCQTSDECCSGDKCQVVSVSAAGVPSKACRPLNDCSAVGGACLSDADCCGGSPCNAQKCQLLPSYTTATYDRTYTASCPSGFKPRWGVFSYHATNSGGSHITFTAKSAANTTDLATAMSVALRDTSVSNRDMMAEGVDVGAKLEAAQISPTFAYLTVSMTFYPSATGGASPILHDWQQLYSCLPAE